MCRLAGYNSVSHSDQPTFFCPHFSLTLQEMEMTMDFVDYLGNDLGLRIMELLNDPTHVVRAAAVSKPWRRLVIANGLCKKLFLKMFPHVAHIVYEIGGIHRTIKLSDILTVNAADWESLEREHGIYSFLLQPLAMPMDRPRDCNKQPICASSTLGLVNNLMNTIDPIDEYPGCRAIWSSEGQVDPGVPEYIIYELCSNICIVSEVKIRPFGVSRPSTSLDREAPTVYSPRSVRFRFGYFRTYSEIRFSPLEHGSVDEYEWVYTSPEFPMAQVAALQTFRLPEPIVCVGGIVQIEMFGRAQMDPGDGLFYIRLGYVQIMGQLLSPAYMLEALENGELQLKFLPRFIDDVLQTFRRDPREVILQDLLWQDLYSLSNEIIERTHVEDSDSGDDLSFTEELLEESIRASPAGSI